MHNTIEVWFNEYNYFNFKEHNNFDLPLLFKYDVIIAILKSDSNCETIYETKNRILHLYTICKKPICIIYNQINDKNDEIPYKKRNEMLQTDKYDKILICVLNFKKEECGEKFEFILQWIIKNVHSVKNQ